MTTWTFDLAQINNWILRLGLHGLWRLLKYAEGNPHYPEIIQTPTLKWTLTDTTVTITFKDVSDLNRLMGCQLGDFRHGLGVPPGYETDPAKPGYYITARAHRGICGDHFFVRKGGRRSQSLNVKIKLNTLEHPRSTADLPKKLELEVTTHQRAPITMAPQLADLKQQSYGTVIHPGFAKYNDTAILGEASDVFLASFSCLAYVWTLYGNNETAGLGIDMPSFTEADQKHQLWSVNGILTVHGDHRTAFWGITAALDLPEQTYSTLYMVSGRKTVVGIFTPSAPKYGQTQVYNLLSSLMDIAGTQGTLKYLRRIDCIPVRVYTTHTVSALDIILANLESGIRWWVGLGEGVTCDRNQHNDKAAPYIGWNQRETRPLSTFFRILETPMEEQIARQMKALFESLVKHYKTHFPSDGWTQARERAQKYAISTKLNRAKTKAGILGALAAIQKESGYYAGFNTTEFNWILKRAATHPLEVQQLLICACALFPDKKPKETPEANVADTPVSEFAGNTNDDND